MGLEFEIKTVVAAGFLAVLWIGESAAPFYAQFRDGFCGRLRHDGKNLALGACNALILASLFAGILASAESWFESQTLGLLRLVTWPVWTECLVAVVLFDLWMYTWHRANHSVIFLWRFHRLHHSDCEMDVTTAVRFHTVEIVFSTVARLFVLLLLGIELWQLAIYELIFLPVVLFHHSNMSIPRWLDHGLLAFIVTPAMHRVHHSRWRPETDSNYGAVLPYWDLLFRTMRLRKDAHDVQFGLDELDESWQSILGMMKTPCAPTERSVTEGSHSKGN